MSRVAHGGSLPEPWSDFYPLGNTRVRDVVGLPVGHQEAVCSRCSSDRLVGVVIVSMTDVVIIEGTDDADPNIMCVVCGYWWD